MNIGDCVRRISDNSLWVVSGFSPVDLVNLTKCGDPNYTIVDAPYKYTLAVCVSHLFNVGDCILSNEAGATNIWQVIAVDCSNGVYTLHNDIIPGNISFSISMIDTNYHKVDCVTGQPYIKCVNHNCIVAPDGTYRSVEECQAAGCMPIAVPWKCIDGMCIQAMDGTYNTLAECQLNCLTVNTPWKCQNNICVQSLDGTYPTQSECQAACGGTPPQSNTGLYLLAAAVIGYIILKR